MEEVSQSVADLNWPALIPVAMLFLVGLVLWATGRRSLRTVVGLGGLVAGIWAGLAAARLPALGQINLPAWSYAVAGAILAAIIVLVLYRLVLAAGVALLFAALAPMGVWIGVEAGKVDFSSAESIAQSPLFAPEPWREAGVEEVPPPPAPDLVPQEPQEPQEVQVVQEAQEAQEPQSVAADTGAAWLDWLDKVVKAAVAVPQAVWNTSDQSLQWILAATAALGALLGLLLGAASPSMSASIVTASFGSLLLGATAWTIATAFDAPLGWAPASPIGLLGWWAVVAIIGLGVQWTLRPRRTDTSAE